MKEVVVLAVKVWVGLVLSVGTVYVCAIVLSWMEAKAQAKVRRKWQNNVTKNRMG